jgi:hypothetical protein
MSELFFVDADLSPYPVNQELLEKSLALFRYIDSHSRTFSIQRLQKIAEIEKKLSVTEQHP